MDLHLHSDVREAQGSTVGHLRHVILDPQTRQVTSLIVQQGAMDAHAVILPIGAVESADDDAVYTHLTDRQLRELTPYAFEQNVAPPPADLDTETHSADYPDEPVDVPNVPPVGAATGITSIAFTPILEIWRYLPAGSIVLGDHTGIVATDGGVGKLADVLADDAAKVLGGVVVREGTFFTHNVEIPAEWIGSLSSDRVSLTVTRAELDRADPD